MTRNKVSLQVTTILRAGGSNLTLVRQKCNDRIIKVSPLRGVNLFQICRDNRPTRRRRHFIFARTIDQDGVIEVGTRMVEYVAF